MAKTTEPSNLSPELQRLVIQGRKNQAAFNHRHADAGLRARLAIAKKKAAALDTNQVPSVAELRAELAKQKKAEAL